MFPSYKLLFCLKKVERMFFKSLLFVNKRTPVQLNGKKGQQMHMRVEGAAYVIKIKRMKE